jgi:hypothetical protein
MKWYLPVGQDRVGWYFEYTASEEDPIADLVSVGLNAIPALMEEEPFSLMTDQMLIQVKPRYYGRAFLVAHKSLSSRQELEEKQRELAVKGWKAAKKPIVNSRVTP